MRTWACVGVAILWAGVAWAERPDLSGTVLALDDTGLAGATVYVWEGRVKEGTSPYCPSCYPDCGKKAVTDEEGRFRIPSLDPSLRFEVLAVAEDYMPMFLESVDPADGEIIFALSDIPESRRAPEHTVRGRIVDPKGRPVAGAIVEPFGMKTARGSRYGAMREAGPDAIAVTNDQGEFRLTTRITDVTLYVRVTARGFAKQNVHTMSTGSEVHEVRMDRGVTVAGYVKKDSEGLEGVEVGMVQQDRNSHTFIGDYSVGTFENGFFEIPNLPAKTDFYIYGIMASLQGKGAVSVRTIRTGKNDERRDFGTLKIERGFSVKGRVVLSDGAAIPPKTRLMIGRDDAWDSLFCELDEEGRFSVSDLPAGEYGITVRVAGYRMSAKNYSLDPLNGGGLMGLIDSDIADLTILLMSGKRNNPPFSASAGQSYGELKKEQIRGWDGN